MISVAMDSQKILIMQSTFHMYAAIIICVIQIYATSD